MLARTILHIPVMSALLKQVMLYSVAAHKTVRKNHSRYGVTVRLFIFIFFKKNKNQEATANTGANYYLFEDSFCCCDSLCGRKTWAEHLQ